MDQQQRWPTVTVVVVNFDGRDYLEPCLASLVGQDYPADRVEIVLVDNASADGSVELVRERFPQVQVVVNDANVGFAPAVNQGARLGNGDILALINNDAVAAPGWLRELVRPMLVHDHVRCTGGLVLDATGEKVDFAGGELSFYGHGFAAHREEAPPTDLRTEPTIFVTGASLATPREFFLEIGGFDDDFFAFFEDVDYGWRVWVLGYETWFVPASVLYHRHHGTIERFGYPRERYMLERNALATIFKNYGDELLSKTLPSSLMLSMLRGFYNEDSDLGDYRIGPDTAGQPDPEPVVSAMTGAHLAAIRDFALLWDKLRPKRAYVQEHRRRDDREILRLFKKPVMPNVPDATFLTVFQSVVDTFDLMWHATTRQRILILTADTLGAKMAGPAIRVWEMARTLSKEHEVVLASMRKPQIQHPGFRVEHITPGNAGHLVGWAEVIVSQGFTMYHFPEIASSEAAVVVDIYDPFHIEALVMRKNEPPHERWATAASDRDVVNDQIERGDLLLCASEKQRDFWLGQLAAVGRINPATYDQDPDLRALLAIAPFGLSEEPPVRTRSAIRGQTEGISDDDLVLLWGGGIYNWFDPATLIEGVAIAAQQEPRLKLFFLGTAHPNPDVPEMMRAAEAYRTAERLGILDKHVFFNDGWVDYDDRANYLLDADVGVSTHFLHIETELSFRTRILDYLWAGLPILATEGDSLSNLVREHDLGEVVRAEDPEDVARALLRIADEERRATCRANVEALAPQMTWERALAPLIGFCRDPRRAPDLHGKPFRYVRTEPTLPVKRSPQDLAKRFVRATRDKGLSTAFRMAANSVKVRADVRRVQRENR
ncbi:MAG: glycosyltransferase [Actinobacteria bacterium]|nr:glycosyltransferase [Actinomycetota bacterium]